VIIYLIRHAKPKVINNNYFEARLSQDGVRQVKEFAVKEKLPSPDWIFSSPYNRTVDTSKTLSDVFHVRFEIKDFLREWNLQSLSLADPEYSAETQKGWTDYNQKVQGGESLSELGERAYNGMITLASTHKGEILFLVSHGTLIEVVCAMAGKRKADESHVTNMNFLDYAIFEFRQNDLHLVRDIAAIKS